MKTNGCIIEFGSGLEYETPEANVIPINMENALCSSQESGGHEGIGYDEW